MEVKEEAFHLGVKALILNAEGNILILKRHSENKEKQTWDLPGGRVQKGELPEITLKREVEEETGLKDLLSTHFVTMELTKFRIALPSQEVGLIFSIYRCAVAGDEKVVLSNEHSAFQWVKPNEAASLLKAQYPQRLVEILMNVNLLKLQTT